MGVRQMDKKQWKKLLHENKLNEGTWAFEKKYIPTMIKELESFKKKWWNKIGDDEFYDGIDSAIKRLEEMKKMNLE